MAITAVGNVSYDQTAWDVAIHYPLRAELYFDSFATVKATNQSMNGPVVTFVLQSDMAANTTTLTETVSATATTLSDSTVALTLLEKGDLAGKTALLDGTSFVPLDAMVANVVGYAAGVSLDTLARNALVAGSNVTYAGTAISQTTIGLTDSLDGDDVRRSVARLKGANVPTFNGSYIGVIHPDVEYDFQETASGKGWRDTHNYSDSTAIYTGETGKWQGVRFISASRAPFLVNASNDAGSTGNIDVYQNLFFGRDALAKGYSKAPGFGPQPRVRPAPITDPMWRFTHVAWYWLGAYGIFREAAIQRVESASTIGTNAS